jgi:hypothetical protein
MLWGNRVCSPAATGSWARHRQVTTCIVDSYWKLIATYFRYSYADGEFKHNAGFLFRKDACIMNDVTRFVTWMNCLEPLPGYGERNLREQGMLVGKSEGKNH